MTGNSADAHRTTSRPIGGRMTSCDSGTMSRRQVWDNKTGLAAPGTMIVLCGVGFFVVYALTVHTTSGRQFGDASLRGAVLTHAELAKAVDGILGVVSVAALLAGATTVALIALARLRRVPGMAAVGLLVAANASTWLLKTQLLSRPDLGLSELTPATHNSLPSGHTTAVFSVVIALMVVVPPRGRRLVALVGGSCSVLTALATMSAGWHRAGDSIAAFLMVGVWAGIVGIVTVLITAGTSEPIGSFGTHGRSRRWLVVAALGSAGLGLAAGFGLVLVGPLRSSPVGALAAFLAGGLLIVAVATLVLVAELIVLDRTAP